MIPDPMEWSVLLKHMDDRDYQAVELGWTGGIEFDVFQIFDSKQMAGVGDDFIQYNNPEADAAIEKARQIVDEEKRMLVWHQVQRILHEDQPYTFLYISKQLEFDSGRLRGVEVTKLGFAAPVQLEWYVPKALQKYAE